jgi:hypothetical protein
MMPTQLLELSDERDMWLSRVLEAEWRAYERGAESASSEYDRGFADGVLAVKAALHGAVTDLRQHLKMWDGRREDFGKPRPGDYQGRGGM